MENMAKKRSPLRRSFTPEFKAEIVELCQRDDRTIGQVARDFDLTETAVRQGVKQAEVDAGGADGLTPDEQAELARLRRENRRLREDVDILKRAGGFLRVIAIMIDVRRGLLVSSLPRPIAGGLSLMCGPAGRPRPNREWLDRSLLTLE